mgnify:CR=1 FL=1
MKESMKEQILLECDRMTVGRLMRAAMQEGPKTIEPARPEHRLLQCSPYPIPGRSLLSNKPSVRAWPLQILGRQLRRICIGTGSNGRVMDCIDRLEV